MSVAVRINANKDSFPLRNWARWDSNPANSGERSIARKSRKAKEKREVATTCDTPEGAQNVQSAAISDVTDPKALAERLASADPATLAAIAKMLQG